MVFSPTKSLSLFRTFIAFRSPARYLSVCTYSISAYRNNNNNNNNSSVWNPSRNISTQIVSHRADRFLVFPRALWVPFVFQPLYRQNTLFSKFHNTIYSQKFINDSNPIALLSYLRISSN